MDTKIYEYLIAVSEQKNISRAAAQCFISQPALTQHIKNMERKLGFSLFKRSSSGWIPSRQGEIFLTAAKRMLQVEKETLEKIRICKANTTPAYRVILDIHLRNLFIDTIWPKFLEQYPETRLSLICSDTDTNIQYLSRQMADIGVFPVCQNLPSQLGCVFLDQSEYRLVLPPNHPLADQFRRNGIDFSALMEETFILHQNFSLYSTMQQQLLEQSRFHPKKILYGYSMQSILRMVRSGAGITFLPDVIIHLAGQDCVSCAFDPPIFFRHAAVYHKEQGLTPMHTLMADLFIQHYRQFH
ncbi:MAG: LysR family transcriptional regulator [Eubacteriales bacterium]|nr:LysR family transcriptional regulator [Eubacteriales bacterium]